VDPGIDVLLIQSADLKVQPVDAGALLVDMRSGVCFELNRTGVEVWNLLAKGATIRSLCAALAARYDVREDVINGDVTAIVEALVRQKLVHVAPPSKEAR
jgi:hypothetical protein